MSTAPVGRPLGSPGASLRGRKTTTPQGRNAPLTLKRVGIMAVFGVLWITMWVVFLLWVVGPFLD